MRGDKCALIKNENGGGKASASNLNITIISKIDNRSSISFTYLLDKLYKDDRWSEDRVCTPITIHFDYILNDSGKEFRHSNSL